MLTRLVNIAVFAAFAFRAGGILLSKAGFKPCGAIRQLDISRYGWQKRHDLARSGNGWHGGRQKWQERGGWGLFAGGRAQSRD